MKHQLRSTIVFALVVGSLFVGASTARAQGFNIGGFNQQSNRNDDDDDDDNDRDNDSNRQGGRRARSNNDADNSTTDQIQQFFPGTQGGTSLNKQGQSGTNQYRRSGQQGNFPGNLAGPELAAKQREHDHDRRLELRQMARLAQGRQLDPPVRRQPAAVQFAVVQGSPEGLEVRQQ